MNGDTEGDASARASLSRAQVEAILTELGAWKDGKQARPLTRQDVDRLMAENARALGTEGPTGRGLSLKAYPGMEFEKGIDLMDAHLEGASLSGARFEGASLSGARLEGATLMDAHLEGASLIGAYLEGADLRFARLDGADFEDAHLEGANLSLAHLEGADISFAHLEGADLSGADLKEADLRYAHLEGTWLAGARLDTTLLEDITWSEGYLAPEEKEDKDYRAAEKVYREAEKVYRALKRAHLNAGIYDVADQFAYREQVCRKKQAFAFIKPNWWNRREWWKVWKAWKVLKLWKIWRVWQEKNWGTWAWLQFAELLFGYGYRWQRVVRAAAIVVGFFWLLYWGLGLGAPAGGPPPALHSLYFSAVSFTAVGYGAWVSASATDLGWPKYLGAAEAIVGVFLMALFLVTFARQYLR